jgi:hypothetical protein
MKKYYKRFLEHINNDFKKDLNSIKIGIKKGYNLPLLPDNIQSIHMNPITRVLRVIDGSVVVFVLLSPAEHGAIS